MTHVVLTREQQRAQHALRSINELRDKKFRTEYKSYAEALPASIVMNGLGQACAMLLAQSKGKPADAHRLVYNHLEDWLRGHGHAHIYPQDEDLLKAIISHGQREYVRAHVESLAYLNWLKKFAQAYLAGPED